MKSWKTTLGGVIAAAGIAMTQSDNSTVKMIGVGLSALGAILTGASARDNNVTSEAAGAKK